jgi:hypothetical protein
MNHDHDQLEELLGAYALDAVDADLRRLLDRHLDTCLPCRAEVSRHHAAVALIVPDGEAPTDVWEGIVAALEETPPPLQLAPVVSLASRRARTTRLLGAVTAVAAVAIAVLGMRVVSQDHRLNQVQTAMAHDDMQRAALAALANPTATTVELRAPAGPAAARIALLPDGRGYLLADGLASLADSRTYQLWALIDGQRISAGTLGTHPKAAAFHVSGHVGGFAVTDEQAPGAVASKNPAVLIGWLRSA